MGNELTIDTPTQILDANLQIKGADDVHMEKFTITRERCINPNLVDSFLRLLRHNTDDVIRQKLNNVESSSKKAKNNHCQDYVNKELYSCWLVRDQIISFCDQEATNMQVELDERYKIKASNTTPELDPRLDPYAASERKEEKEANHRDLRSLQSWVQNQRKVENILQSTSNKILQGACDSSTNYITQFNNFRRTIQ